MRHFNTTGPCEPERHYMLPAAARFPDADHVLQLGGYVVLHAPRQTGKTTTLMALAKQITQGDRYCALYFSCKTAEAAGGEIRASQLSILQQIRERAEQQLPLELRPPAWPDVPDLNLLGSALRAWAQTCPRPLVLFFDEIDALHGLGLRSVLAQLHAGFPNRPSHAPWSVILCGLRDVRDYREAAGKDPERFGSASPFNIKLKSVRLGNFTQEEVAQLYGQHSAETGQPFTQGAIALVMQLSAGQPWLVNALAHEIIAEMNISPPTPITPAHVQEARERLIRQRPAHLDSLAAKLQEDRVRRVIVPVLSGEVEDMNAFDDDLEYTYDLGLISPGNPVEVSNPIYREVIVRVLSAQYERRIPLARRSFVDPEGRLQIRQILSEFLEFWREHGETLLSKSAYHEVAAQLILMAYLQRVVNGGGVLDREFGAGRGRLDILLRWPYLDPQGGPSWQREALELKVWRGKRADPLQKGLLQLEEYLERLGLSTGVLAIFDQREVAPPLPERSTLSEAKTPKGYDILLLRA